MPDIVARRIESKLAELEAKIEEKYATIDSTVTKEELEESVGTVVEDKLTSGEVTVDTIDYGTF